MQRRVELKFANNIEIANNVEIVAIVVSIINVDFNSNRARIIIIRLIRMLKKFSCSKRLDITIRDLLRIINSKTCFVVKVNASIAIVNNKNAQRQQ